MAFLESYKKCFPKQLKYISYWVSLLLICLISILTPSISKLDSFLALFGHAIIFHFIAVYREK